MNFSDYYRSLSIKGNLAKLLKDIALGIKAINAEGFLHCDLKPENILILSSKKCKIIDFGSSFIR